MCSPNKSVGRNIPWNQLSVQCQISVLGGNFLKFYWMWCTKKSMEDWEYQIYTIEHWFSDKYTYFDVHLVPIKYVEKKISEDGRKI